MSQQEVIAARSAYEAALSTFETYRQEHHEVLEEYEHLAVQLNDEIERLKSVLRENQTNVGTTFGEFKISVPKKYDVEALKGAIGEDEASRYIKTKETVDSDAFEKAVKNGVVRQDVYDAVVSKDTPRIIGGPKAPTIFQR